MLEMCDVMLEMYVKSLVGVGNGDGGIIQNVAGVKFFNNPLPKTVMLQLLPN